MNANSRYELYSTKQELQSIINELDNIAQGIKRGFTNIGNEQCAACATRVADKYRAAKRKLNNIDTSKVTEAFAAAHGSA